MANPDYEFQVKEAGCAASHGGGSAEIYVFTADEKKITLKIRTTELVKLYREIARELRSLGLEAE